MLIMEEVVLQHKRIGKTAKVKRRALHKAIMFFIINLALLAQ